MSKYLSITEFAKKANLSRTTVYRKLESELLQYCITENGKKLISETALQVVKQNEHTESTECDTGEQKCYTSEQKCYTECNTVTETSKNVQSVQKVSTETEMLQNTIDFLKKQVDEKDKQINYLMDVLKTLTAQPKQKPGFFQRLFGSKKNNDEVKLLPSEIQKRGL